MCLEQGCLEGHPQKCSSSAAADKCQPGNLLASISSTLPAGFAGCNLSVKDKMQHIIFGVAVHDSIHDEALLFGYTGMGSSLCVTCHCKGCGEQGPLGLHPGKRSKLHLHTCLMRATAVWGECSWNCKLYRNAAAVTSPCAACYLFDCY